LSIGFIREGISFFGDIQTLIITLFIFYRFTFKAVLEEMPFSVVLPVIVIDIAGAYFFHSGCYGFWPFF